MLCLGYQLKVSHKLINPAELSYYNDILDKSVLCGSFLTFLSFELFSFKAIFYLYLKSLVGIRKVSWEVLVLTTKTWPLVSCLWYFVGFEMLLSFVLCSKKINIADWLFLTLPVFKLYNWFNIWGGKLPKTQCISTSLTWRLRQGRRIYRFISIWELCLKIKRHINDVFK